MDHLEERRLLSTLESALRLSAKTSISRLTASKVVYSRQRAKLKHCVLGNENTHYFHLCASGHLRKNQIKVLDGPDGSPVFSHPQNPLILHSFRELLGSPVLPPSVLNYLPLSPPPLSPPPKLHPWFPHLL